MTFKRALFAALVLSMAACRRAAPEAPVATPSLTVNNPKAPQASPIDLTYRFDVAPDAPPFKEDYVVFVGVVNADEELMWTDDHNPPTPTTQWKPGQTVTYTRTVFVPVYPYVGEASIHMGLYSPTTKKRLRLSGQDMGLRAYKVATLQLLPSAENVFVVFKDGWHVTETPPGNKTVEWQWTKKDATLAFKNPRRDCLFYLELDQPGNVFQQPQHVAVQAGGQALDQFDLAPKSRILRKIPIAAAQLGTGELAEIQIDVDKTFVPALVNPGVSKDPRELGVRVFHAFIEAR